MTRIDFHTNVTDKMEYACRLVRKARAAAPDTRILILLKNRSEIAALDRALWTFSEQDFVPHAAADDTLAEHSPVVLSDDAGTAQYCDIMVNLSGKLPTQFAQFVRVFEIVSQDVSDTEAGRDRYGYYRQRGYPLTHSAVSPS